MSARWQITTLSTKDHLGRYIDEVVAADESFERVYDAEELIAGCTVELWRITRDDERRSPTSPLEEQIEDAITVSVIGRYAVVAVSGVVRHEVYRLVLVFEPVAGSDWSRTRHLACVA